MRRCEFELRSDAVRATLISSIFWYESGKKKQTNNETKQNKSEKLNPVYKVVEVSCCRDELICGSPGFCYSISISRGA